MSSAENHGNNLKGSIVEPHLGKPYLMRDSPAGIQAKEIMPGSSDGTFGRCYYHERYNKLSDGGLIP